MFIENEVIHEIVIEKSRFITYLKRVDDIDAYKEYLSQIKKKHFDATHVCSALLLKDTRRSSDDGEPSGTAGVPMLTVLEKNEMENICALVVRYFGGIKLGAGGLIRAYQKSVSEALDRAIKSIEVSCPVFELTVDYEMASRIEQLFRSRNIPFEVFYHENVTFTFVSEEMNLIEDLTSYTKGKKAKYIGEKIVTKMI